MKKAYILYLATALLLTASVEALQKQVFVECDQAGYRIVTVVDSSTCPYQSHPIERYELLTTVGTVSIWVFVSNEVKMRLQTAAGAVVCSFTFNLAETGTITNIRGKTGACIGVTSAGNKIMIKFVQPTPTPRPLPGGWTSCANGFVCRTKYGISQRWKNGVLDCRAGSSTWLTNCQVYHKNWYKCNPVASKYLKKGSPNVIWYKEAGQWKSRTVT
jgi:hypothetical protein